MAKAGGSRTGTSTPSGFVLRITTATALGEGPDGYDLGIVSVVVRLIVSQDGPSIRQSVRRVRRAA